MMAVLACDEGRKGATLDVSSVILILVDSLRADVLPPNSGDSNFAPFLEELAEKSLVYRNVRSVSTWTAPATASIFTSILPNQHGVERGIMAYSSLAKQGSVLPFNRLPDEIETLPEFMAGRGYVTFGVTSNINITSRMGFDRGFEHFEAILYDGTRGNARNLIDQVLRWKDKLDNAEKFFLYIHLMDAHTPYTSHDSADSKPNPSLKPGDLLALYGEEVRFLDGQLRRLFAELDLDDAIVFVTADHGEAFGEHHTLGHGFSLYSEALRVPLIIRLPTCPPTHAVIESSASILDILPTLRVLVGSEPSATDIGFSLLSASGKPASLPERDHFAMINNSMPKKPNVQWSIVRGGMKLIQNNRTRRLQLFDLENDAAESVNLAPNRLERTQALVNAINELKRSKRIEKHLPGDSANASREDVEILRALGYVEDPL